MLETSIAWELLPFLLSNTNSLTLNRPKYEHEKTAENNLTSYKELQTTGSTFINLSNKAGVMGSRASVVLINLDMPANSFLTTKFWVGSRVH